MEPKRDRPLFSLIMCLYGVEDYVGDAIAAIRAQEYQDWELIVIDDAAEDKSVLRALKAAKGDKRIRIVHNDRNMGLAASRNHGLDLVKGDYVTFPDAEDLPGPDYLSSAAAAIATEDPDIVVEGVVQDFFNHRGRVAFSEELVPPAGVATGEEVDRLVLPLGCARLLDFVFTKFFRTSMVGDARFEVDVRHYTEDYFWVLEMFERAEKVVVLDSHPYRFEKHLRPRRQLEHTEGAFLMRHRRVAAIQLHQQEHGLDTPESRALLGASYGRAIMDELGRLTDPMGPAERTDAEALLARLRDDPLFQLLIRDGEEPTGFVDRRIHRALTAKGTGPALRLGRLMGYLATFGPESWSRTQPSS